MSRTIKVMSTKNSRKYTLESNATTLGELKAEFSAAGIDYSDMEFTEGITKTTFIDDSSILPEKVMFKGRETSDLVIILTNTQKKINSGADMSRPQVYAYIKEHNLGEAIKEAFGKNYTTVSTDALIEFLDNYREEYNEEEHFVEPDECNCEQKEVPCFKCEAIEGIKESISNLVNALYLLEGLTSSEVASIRSILNLVKESGNKTAFSDDELDEIFNSVV